MKFNLRLSLTAALGVAALCVGAAHPAYAVEEAAEFLEELRKRGLYEQAEYYLESMKTSPLVDDDFKGAIPYEIALVKVAAANASQNQGAREANLLAAIEDFKKFREASPNNPMAAEVDLQVANILLMLGQTRVVQMERPGEDVEARRKDALTYFDQAMEMVGKKKEGLIAALKEIPDQIPQNNKRLIDRRDELRRQFLKVELLHAAAARQRAQAFPADSKEYKAAMTDAANKYEQLFIQHRRRLAGLFARLQQGICLLDLKQPQDSLSCFYELIDQDPSEESLRTMRLQAIRYAMQAAIELERYNDAVQLGKLVSGVRNFNTRSAEGLAIQYMQAKASFEHISQLDKDKDRRQIADLTRDARSGAEFVARYNSEFKQPAIELLSKMGRNVEALSTTEPTNASEAVQQGDAARNAWTAAKEEAAGKTGDEQTKALEEAEKLRQDAFNHYRLAVTLAKPGDEAALNQAHYFLCFLYWDEKNFPAAAVSGEYLARNYPDFAGSKSAATIAMAAWLNLYGEEASDDKSFESAKVQDIARYLTVRWPNEPETGKAYATLVNFALVEGRLDDALADLEKVPADAPERGELAIKIGQSLWSRYLAANRKTEEEGRPPQAELDAMEAKAHEVLESGVSKMATADKADRTVANAVLALAQLYADSSRPADAIQWLENPNIGSLTLVAKNDPAAQHEPYAEETYKVALRSYVSVLPELSPEESEATMKKAEQVMDSLEKTFGQDGKESERLTRIYISMGKQLQDQLELLGDREAKLGLSRAFEKFLARIGARGEGNTFQSLTWVAETFYSLGEGFDTAKGRTPDEAKAYYKQAAENYQRILDRTAKDPSWAPNPNAALSIRMRLASCLRRLGDLKQATDLFVQILTERQGNVTAQIEAALVYQERGAVENPQFYRVAIQGARDIPGKPGEKLIWGWSKIAKLTGGNAQFADQFQEASYQGIVCRYELAKTMSGSEKTDLMNVAKRTMEVMHKRFPQMGGDAWRPKYDALLKDIQEALGEPRAGLKAFETPGETVAGRN